MTMQRRGFFAALAALFAAPTVFHDIGRNEVISTADLDWSTRAIEIPIESNDGYEWVDIGGRHYGETDDT